MAPRDPPPAWPGLRPLRVLRRVSECRHVASLVLGADDGGRLPAFRPGQFVTLSLDLPGGARPRLAVYSLSGAPDAATWRITVKDLGPDGPQAARGSAWLVRGVGPGDLLQARAPAGRFGADLAGDGPLVLVAGGIGVTPFVPMLHAAATARTRRPITVVLGMRRGDEHPLRSEVALSVQALRGARLVTVYSQPGAGDVAGRDHDRAGRVDAALLQAVLPPADAPYTFLLCGPPAMLQDLQAGLRGLGVPDSAVQVEVFGQRSVRATTRLPESPAGTGPAVTFLRAGKTVPWDPSAEALLYLAERHGVPIPSACAAGRCGACLTPLREGRVSYRVPPGFPALREGACLPCVAVPDGPVTLDA